MAFTKLTLLSTEELKEKEKSLTVVLTILLVVLATLTVVLMYLVYSRGITPLIAVPISLLPVLVLGKRNLKEIKAEIQSRK